MGLLDKLQSSELIRLQLGVQSTDLSTEIELYKLEQKYAKRKNRQTFTTGATYVDGEYHYDSSMSQPISATSTGSSMGKRSSMLFGSKR